MRLSFPPPAPPAVPVHPRDGLYGLICGDVKIAKINTELLTLNIQAIDWAGSSQTLVVRGPSMVPAPLSPFRPRRKERKISRKLRLDGLTRRTRDEYEGENKRVEYERYEGKDACANAN